MKFLVLLYKGDWAKDIETVYIYLCLSINNIKAF